MIETPNTEDEVDEEIIEDDLEVDEDCEVCDENDFEADDFEEDDIEESESL